MRTDTRARSVRTSRRRPRTDGTFTAELAVRTRFASAYSFSSHLCVPPRVIERTRRGIIRNVKVVSSVVDGRPLTMRTLTTLVFAGLMVIGGVAAAQESTAEVRGRVLDAQGGSLPGVMITITNQATGVYREVVSNQDGTYFATAL